MKKNIPFKAFIPLLSKSQIILETFKFYLPYFIEYSAHTSIMHTLILQKFWEEKELFYF
jgi:hypothetical protein